MNILEMNDEQVVETINGMKRPDLESFLKERSVKELAKIINALSKVFAKESDAFLVKKNRSAGLRSRNATTNMQVAFLQWRKKSIKASQDLTLIDK